MTESILSIIVGLAACFGILASIAYPFLRKRFGLANTGLIALTCQISCLTISVISLWLPGGTFGPPSDVHQSSANVTCVTNSTTFSNTTTSNNGTSCVEIIENEGISSMSTSLVVLFIGILGARFGKFSFDVILKKHIYHSAMEPHLWYNG